MLATILLFLLLLVLMSRRKSDENCSCDLVHYNLNCITNCWVISIFLSTNRISLETVLVIDPKLVIIVTDWHNGYKRSVESEASVQT